MIALGSIGSPRPLSLVGGPFVTLAELIVRVLAANLAGTSALAEPELANASGRWPTR
jgi:hypothetical protein